MEEQATDVREEPAQGHPGRARHLQRRRAPARPAEHGHGARARALSILSVGGGTGDGGGITTALSAIAKRAQGHVRQADPRGHRDDERRLSDHRPRATPTPSLPRTRRRPRPRRRRSRSTPSPSARRAASSTVAGPAGRRPLRPGRHGAHRVRERWPDRSPRRRARQLASIYDQIGRDVGFVVQTRELTAAFAGAALLVALLAAAGAWSGRSAWSDPGDRVAGASDRSRRTGSAGGQPAGHLGAGHRPGDHVALGDVAAERRGSAGSVASSPRPRPRPRARGCAPGRRSSARSRRARVVEQVGDEAAVDLELVQRQARR